MMRCVPSRSIRDRGTIRRLLLSKRSAWLLSVAGRSAGDINMNPG